ncbi:MAG: speE [Gammaproteobacteria bacterium]|jgi:spermidine synthase|nr:speE [Gammaproteobacteria bacterium]
MSNIWLHESLYKTYCQSFQIDKVLAQHKTLYQDLLVFENQEFGRVLVLDGAIQLTTRDEFIYHEMMSHVPIIAHGNVKHVLIIGGGDGGIAREVLKHSGIESVTLVEIDEGVVEASKQYFPEVCKGVFDHPKFSLRIEDGIQFVKNHQNAYDLIITDSNDPIGPAKVLFTDTFYGYCKQALKKEGILVTQNGDFFMQPNEYQDTYRHLSFLFKEATFFLANVPTYIGSYMTLGYASDNPEYRKLDIEALQQRITKADIKTRYYNASMHQASFVLPQFLLENLENAKL